MIQVRRKELFEARRLTPESCFAYWIDRVSFWPEEDLSISGSYHPEQRTISHASIQVRTGNSYSTDFVRAYLGDWIIRDQSGHLSVCSPESFNALYENVPASPSTQRSESGHD